MGCFWRSRFPVHENGGVLISGASSGLGYSVAVALAEKGYLVFAGVRSDEAASRLKKENPSIVPVMLDVGKQESVDACINAVKATLSERKENLVALFNNAGIGFGMPIEFVDMADIEEMFNVNVYGVFRLYKACIPLLRETGPGARIVNTSSLAGICTLQGGTGYNGTKHALEAISDGSRLELAPFGISVSTINPGFMRTEIMNKLEVEYLELTQAQKELYPNFFKKIKEIKEMLQYADTVESGPMPAVIHAITSPRPKTRYLVASIGGVPAWFMAYLKWFLPASTFDKLSLEGETLPHKKTQRVHHLR